MAGLEPDHDVQPFLPSEAVRPACYNRFSSSNFQLLPGCSPACNVNNIQVIDSCLEWEKKKVCGLPSVRQECPICSVNFSWFDCFSKLCRPFGDKNVQTKANSPQAFARQMHTQSVRAAVYYAVKQMISCVFTFPTSCFDLIMKIHG